MKKGFLKLIALVMILSISLSLLVGCLNQSEPEHTHAFSQSYHYDDENHWTQCNCMEKYGVEAHSGGEPSCAEQGKCGICGTPYGELLPHEFTISKSDDRKHWIECVCGAKSNSSYHIYSETKSDELHHWLECECGAKANVEDHSVKNIDKTEGTHSYQCKCGYQSEPATHVFDIVITYFDAVHYMKCSCGYEEGVAAHVLENFI